MYLVQSLDQNGTSSGIYFSFLFSILNEESCKAGFKSSYEQLDSYPHDKLRNLIGESRFNYAKTDIIELESYKDIFDHISVLLEPVSTFHDFKLTFYKTSDINLIPSRIENIIKTLNFYYNDCSQEEKDKCLYVYSGIVTKLNSIIEYCKQNVGTILKELEKVLSSYYGDNLYKQESSFVIHYPHIKIQNSLGREHDIYDLFFRIVPNLSGETLYLSFQGCRTTLSDAERRNEYLHSHLNPCTDRGSYKNFCIGSGHMNEYLQIQNKDKLMSLPVAIDRYVEWESLEGGPYRNLSGNYSNSNSNERIRNLSANEKHSVIQKAILENAVTLDIINNRVNINVRSNYIPDAHYVKIGNSAYIAKDVPQNITSKEDISFSKVEGRLNLTNAKGQIVTFDFKKVNVPQTNSSKAEVKNFFENSDLSYYVSSDSIITSIINKATNELIEFK